MIGWNCLLMSTLLVTAPVEVRGGGRCPSSTEVAQHLAELLPAAAANRPPDLVHLDAAEPDRGGVTLTLRRADGTLLARKSLARSRTESTAESRDGGLRGSPDGAPTCADLAAAAALIVATWESDVHPEFKLDVPRRPPVDRPTDRLPERGSDGALPRARANTVAVQEGPAVPAPPQPAELSPPPLVPAPERTAVFARGEEARPLSSERPGAPRLRSSASAAVGGVAPPRPPASTELRAFAVPPLEAPAVATPVPRPAPVTLEAGSPGPAPSAASIGSVIDLGLGVIGAMSPSDREFAGGATLAGGWTGARGWGAHLGLLATTERTISLSAGQVNWRRVTVTLGPQHRWGLNGGRLNLDVRADGVAALLTMRGTGFASNASDQAIDPGMSAAVRVSAGRGRWRPWVEVSAVGWLIRRLAYESPDNGALPFPRLETMLAVGFSHWNAL